MSDREHMSNANEPAEKCQSCKVEITEENRGGNIYYEVWCQKCWDKKKDKSWGSLD